MRASKALIAPVVAVVLAGCVAMTPKTAPPPPGASKKECRGSDCDLQITVTDCVIKPEADVIEIIDASPAARSMRKIEWRITSSGYKFSTDMVKYGIVIKDYDPTRQFEDPMNQVTRFSLKFKNSFKKPDGYAYAVNIVKDDGTVCATLDPWVVN